MKTLKQIREEYDSELLDSVDFLPEEIMLESDKKTSLVSSTPSFKQMPALLLFRRMTYRKYPGNQTVALYYSALVDKYLSIPFGPTGNLNLSEAVIHDEMNEDLRKWFKEKWVRYDTKGNIKGDCAREEGEGKPKCRPLASARAMSKEDRAKSARRKRREDPVADRPGKGGKPVMVKTNEETLLEKNVPTNPALWARAKSQARAKFDVYPSAYANGWASKWYKSKGGGWKTAANESIEEACWDTHKQVGMKKKGNRMVPDCVLKDEVTMDESEAWQRKEGQNPEGGLNRKGIASYRRENPGSKLSMAVTTKPSKLKPGSKAANRRKSFCARMGGMKKRLTSAKTARDPDSRINKALRKWNCEESFNNRLEELRQERLNELSAAGVADTVTDYVIPYKSAYKEYKKGNYGTAALHAGIDTVGLGATVASGGIGAPAAAAGTTAAKAGLKAGIKTGLKSGVKTAGTVAKTVGKTALKGLVKYGLSGGEDKSDATPYKGTLSTSLRGVKTKSRAAELSPTSDSPTQAARDAALERRYREKSMSQMKENKMSDIRKMVRENVEYKDLYINGRSVTLNKNMAKRILEVYDSVNSKNKKLVENMLNEDMESFKKLLNFTIKA